MSRPGRNTDPNPGSPGPAPYEMAGRPEAHPPIAHFADCTVWMVEAQDAEANLYRTQEQRLFRDYCGKLVYRATGKRPVITVRPTEPLPIPEPWDCVNAWNWGNVWAWVRQKDTPPLLVEVLILDAEGEEHAIGMGRMAYQYWFPMHRKMIVAIPRPARFAGFRFRNGTNTEERRVYLGPISFYKEELKPLSFDPWPEKLPFPTRPETILPDNVTAVFTNTVRKDGDATLFEYRGDDTTLAYRFDPSRRFLDGLDILWNGRSLSPCRSAQVVFGNGENAEIRTTGVTPAKDSLAIDWLCVAGEVRTTLSVTIRLAQKSLILDLEERGEGAGNIAKVTLGQAENLRAPQTIWIPYLTFGRQDNDPRLLLDDGLFVFSQFDWYVSEASELFGTGGRTGRDWALFSGGAEYRPRTDGTRNRLHERLFLTASPEVHEVFPTIPNPPSPMREAQADRLWRIRHGPHHAVEIENARHLRALGLEKVTVRYHEDSWRDAGESFTFRTDAAPGRGGDEALRKMVAAVKETGWRVGLYTNYTDFAPVNAYWNEDWVTRTPDGNWRTGWARCYAPKPMIAVQMEALLAPQIQAKFGENHSYCDVHTCVTPFERVDYDARVPGAGTFRRTFECFGRLLYNEKFAHRGPVYSEGRNHWWYAGLTDGNYAQLAAVDPPREPLFVNFDLLKMHPLQMDAGMGSPGMFYRGSSLRNYRQFIATTLAYGHIGFLEAGEADMMRMYYLLQPLQPHYVMRKTTRIAYGDEEPASRALASGAVAGGQLHVTYEGGTDIRVNGGAEPWTVDMPGLETSLTLPPWGFAGCADGGRVRSMNALLPAVPGDSRVPVPSRAADLAHGPDSHYLASAGGFLRTAELATDGGGVLKHEAAGWELIPAREFGLFGFDPALVDCETGTFAVCALAEDGTLGEAVPLRWSRGLCYVQRGKDAPFKYRIVPGEGDARPVVTPRASDVAVLGQAVQVTFSEAIVPEAAVWHGPAAATRSVVPTKSADGWAVPVPGDLPANAPLWLELPTGGQTLWLDFLGLAPLALRLETVPCDYAPGEAVRVRAFVANRLEWNVPVTIALIPDIGTVVPDRKTLAVGAGGEAAADIPWELLWQAGEAKLEASAEAEGTSVCAALRVRAEIASREFMDLLGGALPWRKGSCSRGEEETTDLPTVYDGSANVNQASCGGVQRQAFFMHPPWGKRPSGYVYAELPLDLPKEAVQLHAFTGLRDGMDASDGVVFSVRVTPEQGPSQTVFERHHTALLWDPMDVDLSPFAGQRVTLRLQVDCGPADNTTADHSQWGDLALVFTQRTLRVTPASR